MQILHVLFAQTQAPAGGGAASLAPFLFQIGAIFLIFYFLMIRPQQKQRKAHEASILALKKGDQVVTAGGIVGEVVHIKEGQKDGAAAPGMGDHITIRSGESRLIVTRGRIAAVGSEDPGTP
jgi:preprotein translocase subunit YajC